MSSKEVTDTQVSKAKALVAEWRKSSFQGSYNSIYLMTEEDVLQNFAEWIVCNKKSCFK